MKVIFSERAFTALLAETYEKIKTETGGIFLGYYENDVWYVVETIDPGPKSVFEVAYFEYDEKYVNHLINKIARLYKKNLSLLGLWHRHPGSFDVFSNTDDGTNFKYARLFPQGAISALVNIDPQFRLTMYHVSNPLAYQHISFEVGDSLFPEGLLQIHSVENYIDFINNYGKQSRSKTNKSSQIGFGEILEAVCKKAKDFDGNKYKDEIIDAINKEGFFDKIADAVFEDIDYIANTLNIQLNFKRAPRYVYLCDANDESEKLYLSYIESLDKFVFVYKNYCYEYSSGLIKSVLEGTKKEEKRGAFFIDEIKKIFKGDKD